MTNLAQPGRIYVYGIGLFEDVGRLASERDRAKQYSDLQISSGSYRSALSTPSLKPTRISSPRRKLWGLNCFRFSHADVVHEAFGRFVAAGKAVGIEQLLVDGRGAAPWSLASRGQFESLGDGDGDSPRASMCLAQARMV